VGSSLRNPDETTADSAPLFNMGGESLNVTWGEWKAAQGSSVTQRTQDRRIDIHVQLEGLLPSSVYSLFYLTLTPDSSNPKCPGVERALPLLSVHRHQQPDRSSFVTDANGGASFHARAPLRSHILTADQVVFEAIYHFDGQTWGDLPNHGEFNTQGPSCVSTFSEDAMRHLLILQRNF
jgi:hypothetical protein